MREDGVTPSPSRKNLSPSTRWIRTQGSFLFFPLYLISFLYSASKYINIIYYSSNATHARSSTWSNTHPHGETADKKRSARLALQLVVPATSSPAVHRSLPNSLSVSATSRHYFILTTNQPSAIFFSQNKPAPGISHQPNQESAQTRRSHRWLPPHGGTTHVASIATLTAQHRLQ
jgi:hypothetical protein